MIKGGGSDNASRLHMLVPGDGKQGIIDHVVACVKEKAAAACPPLILGIGIGGTFDNVSALAQKALYRPVGQHSKNEKTASLEQEILQAVNKTGVGPGGLGGVTVSQVNVETAACHIASMPLAIDMGCSALRRITIDVPCLENDELGANLTVLPDNIESALESALSPGQETIDNAKISVEKNMKNAESGNDANIAGFSSIKTISAESLAHNQSEPKRLQLPLLRDDLSKFRVGDKVLLNGPIYTLRDAGHIRLLNEMKLGQPLPYNLEGQTIYYAGPSPAKAGRPFGAIGPTTATRMDFATPTLYESGIVATIGKGHRSKEVHESCVKNGTVFFCTVGGSAAYLAKCITSAELIAYEDLGTEALRKCIVKDFPVYVGIDTKGNDVYER